MVRLVQPCTGFEGEKLLCVPTCMSSILMVAAGVILLMVWMASWCVRPTSETPLIESRMSPFCTWEEEECGVCAHSCASK